MKIYIILGSIIAILGAFTGTGWFAYQAGKKAEMAHSAAKAEEYRQNQALLTQALEKARSKERVIVKTKIRTIRTAVDPSGCKSTDIPDNILSQLQ